MKVYILKYWDRFFYDHPIIVGIYTSRQLATNGRDQDMDDSTEQRSASDYWILEDEVITQ